jgi:hypothetical protein
VIEPGPPESGSHSLADGIQQEHEQGVESSPVWASKAREIHDAGGDVGIEDLIGVVEHPGRPYMEGQAPAQVKKEEGGPEGEETADPADPRPRWLLLSAHGRPRILALARGEPLAF